jgi:hypothetical protein
MKTHVTFALILVLFTVNCSSIVHGTTQQVKVDSEPSGAAVTVECGDVANDPKLVTPAVVNLHRKPDYCALKLNKEGYAPKEVRFAQKVSGWYFGNILVGGLVGLIVDAANGAMWNRNVSPATKEGVSVAPKGEVKVTLAAPAAESN